MALERSRGIETVSLVRFMRASSLVSDVLVYVSAVVAFSGVLKRILNVSSEHSVRIKNDG